MCIRLSCVCVLSVSVSEREMERVSVLYRSHPMEKLVTGSWRILAKYKPFFFDNDHLAVTNNCR